MQASVYEPKNRVLSTRKNEPEIQEYWAPVNHEARAKAVLDLLTKRRRDGKPLSRTVAFVHVGQARQEGPGAVQGSWYKPVNNGLRDRAAYVAMTRSESLAREKLSPLAVAEKVAEKLALRPDNLSWAVYAVVAETEYSPCWVRACYASQKGNLPKPVAKGKKGGRG